MRANKRCSTETYSSFSLRASSWAAKATLKTRRRVHFAVLNTGARHHGQPRQCVFDLRFEGIARHLHAREQAARQAIFLIDQTGEQMFPIHFLVPRAQRDLLRLLHGLARFFSHLFMSILGLQLSVVKGET